MEKVNKKWLEQRSEQELKETIIKVEVDEMHSFVAKKDYDRWLWQALDHQTEP